jgi:hypothetical protein
MAIIAQLSGMGQGGVREVGGAKQASRGVFASPLRVGKGGMFEVRAGLTHLLALSLRGILWRCQIVLPFSVAPADTTPVKKNFLTSAGCRRQ